jgi:hypothetical protein
LTDKLHWTMSKDHCLLFTRFDRYNNSKVVPKLITFTSHKKRLKLNEATDKASSTVFIEHGILHILNERKKGTVPAIVIIKKQPSNSSRQIQKTFF